MVSSSRVRHNAQEPLIPGKSYIKTVRLGDAKTMSLLSWHAYVRADMSLKHADKPFAVGHACCAIPPTFGECFGEALWPPMPSKRPSGHDNLASIVKAGWPDHSHLPCAIALMRWEPRSCVP